MNKNSKVYAAALTLLSAFGRLIPHAPNVTPLGASCLFAGSRIEGLLAYLLPLVVMAVTDPFVGGYSKLSPLIYGCFLMNVWIGRKLLHRPTAMRIGGTAFLCSLQFFLLTNLGIWALTVVRGSHYYTSDLSGLLACYTAAIPYWGRTLAGDLVYSAVIFGLYALLERTLLERATVPAQHGGLSIGEQQL